MPYIITTATKKIAALKKRIRALPGGTSAGKTIGTIEVLIDLAQRDIRPTVTSIVSESFPHLRRGAMRDFENIMKEQNYWKDSLWDKTNSIYTFETGSKIEFFSVDQSEKVRGARRDRLFINEANNISFQSFEELEVRTKEFVILDWNPSSEFWYYTDVKGKREDVEEITLTFRDNEALDPQIVNSILQRKNRKGWWDVYGLGRLGEVEGKIYKDWEIIEELPHQAKLQCYGLDYGYTNDPTAIIAIYYYNGGYILDEVDYQKGLSNKQISDILSNQEKAPIIPDSAEPKSNDELKGYGHTIVPAEKGKDSVNNGIQLVQAQRVSVTKRSVNLIREYRNYLWETDPNGKVLNIPEHTFSHSMDAVRYGLSFLLKKPVEIRQFRSEVNRVPENSNK